MLFRKNKNTVSLIIETTNYRKLENCFKNTRGRADIFLEFLEIDRYAT